MSKVRTELEVPEELLNEFDNAIKGHYANRSEALRASMRLLIDKLNEGKVEGELLRGLEEFLTTRLPKPEDKESVKKAEVERFKRKWGEPEILETEPAITTPPYVSLRRTQTFRISDRSSLTLKIFNAIVWKAIIAPDNLAPRNLLEFDPEIWKHIASGKLEYIVGYLKSKGFTVGEYHQDLTPHMLKDFVTDGNFKVAEEMSRASKVGLFGVDGEDLVFIAYREVKSK